MPATAAQYERLLLQLLPPGAAWAREPGSVLRGLLGARAEELARQHGRAEALIEEADPRTTLELLGDWERVAGLPDDCAGAADTLEERRAALVARLTGIGGQSAAYYIGVAATVGYPVTVSEFGAFTVGASAVGDPLCGMEWRYAWRVNAPATAVRAFQVGSSAVGEKLRDWGEELLECIMQRLKPAHTIVLFRYANDGVLVLDTGDFFLLDDGSPLQLD